MKVNGKTYIAVTLRTEEGDIDAFFDVAENIMTAVRRQLRLRDHDGLTVELYGEDVGTESFEDAGVGVNASLSCISNTTFSEVHG